MARGSTEALIQENTKQWVATLVGVGSRLRAWLLPRLDLWGLKPSRDLVQMLGEEEYKRSMRNLYDQLTRPLPVAKRARYEWGVHPGPQLVGLMKQLTDRVKDEVQQHQNIGELLLALPEGREEAVKGPVEGLYHDVADTTEDALLACCITLNGLVSVANTGELYTVIDRLRAAVPLCQTLEARSTPYLSFEGIPASVPPLGPFTRFP